MKQAEQGGCYGGTISITTAIFLCFFLQPSTAFWGPLNMEEFTIFALKEKSTQNTTIHFNLHIHSWSDQPIDHDALNISFYYNSNNIGNVTFAPRFIPENGWDNYVGNFEAKRVILENSQNNTIVPPLIYRVEVASSYWINLDLFIESRRIYYKVGAELKVDDKGNLVNKGVELSAAAAPLRNVKGRLEMAAMWFCVLFFLHYSL